MNKDGIVFKVGEETLSGWASKMLYHLKYVAKNLAYIYSTFVPVVRPKKGLRRGGGGR